MAILYMATTKKAQKKKSYSAEDRNFRKFVELQEIKQTNK